MTRRQFASWGLLLSGMRPPLQAADPSYSKEFPDMLLAHLAGKLNVLARQWDQERAKIKTSADVEARNQFVRAKALEMIHGLPERTPLNPAIVNRFQRESFRIETLMFQSRPNFWVTASLYIPEGKGPFPGIISPCGHEYNARLYRLFQLTYMDLAKSGFVVLAYDPIGQGERRHFWNPQTNNDELGGPLTWEHSLPGQLLLLLGEDLTHYRIWDGMRAIDYLLTRPEVDGKRIGCTGQSGGGTFTLFISALDERIRCAAMHQGGSHHRYPFELKPETYITTGDTEQHMFPAATYGVDMCDLHVAIAPRPLLATIEKYSPGFNEVAEHVRRRYEQMGVPDRFAVEEAADPHGMTMKLRLATTAWFSKWFYERPGLSVEPEWKLEPLDKMYCTPNGSVRYSAQGDTIYSLILKKQAHLPPDWRVPGTADEVDAFRREMQGLIRKLLHLPIATLPLAPRRLATTPRRGYEIEKLELLSEAGIYIPTWVFKPERPIAAPPILFVSEAGLADEGMEFGPVEMLARKGRIVAAIDVRGMGETRPEHPSDHFASLFGHVDDAETVMAYLAWEMNESLFGMRVFDVLRSADYLLSRPDVAQSGLQAVGKGMGALWLMFAAALDHRFQAVVAESGLLSYRALTCVDRYLHGANVFIIDVLKHFDLPHVAAAMADRRLTLIAPVDHMKQPVPLDVGRGEYEFAHQVYTKAGAAERFRIVRQPVPGEIAEPYNELFAQA